MFFPVRFKTHIQLPPTDLNSDFNDAITQRIKKKLEGVCSRFGYIKPGSLEVLHRSAGVFIKQHFNGHIRFDIYCKGEVCNPPQGMIVEARVKNKNALGLLAESTVLIRDGDKEKELSILDIIVPRKAAGIASEVNLDDIQIGDTIYVMVMGKRYQLNDTNISIIGRAVKSMHPFRGEGVDGIVDDKDDGVDASDTGLDGEGDAEGDGDENEESDRDENDEEEDEDYESIDNTKLINTASPFDDLDDGNDIYEDNDGDISDDGIEEDNDVYENE